MESSDNNPRSSTTGIPNRHLDAEEMDEALRFGLEDDRSIHLAHCKGCQSSVEWTRLASLGLLWDEEHDWAKRVFDALVKKAAAQGKTIIRLSELTNRYGISKIR